MLVVNEVCDISVHGSVLLGLKGKYHNYIRHKVKVSGRVDRR